MYKRVASKSVTMPQFGPGLDPGASFTDLLRRHQGHSAGFVPTAGSSTSSAAASASGVTTLTHATTIVALRYDNGVIMAGDRRATMGNVIAHRSMRKVFPADNWSAVSISGVAGVAEEMVKLFQLELEHYEKVEGVPLSLEGKATRLGNMVRGNLSMALQAGMVVIPIFAGFDRRRNVGRIFNYDITGGRYEEVDFHATGSGGTYARSVLKLRWAPGMSRNTASEIAVEALFEAAEEDSATGGPDPIRGIYPMVTYIETGGYEELTDADVAQRFEALMARRRANGGRTAGPVAITSVVAANEVAGQ
jgi:proteasome beta subunit